MNLCDEISSEVSQKLIQGPSDRLSMACSMTIFHDNLCEVSDGIRHSCI
jgi:hypothetical protein